MSGNQGGSHEQHVKAGQQSHKNTSGATSGAHEGSKEKQMTADDQGRKNMGGSDSGSHEGSSRGGTHEQHVKAGQQSHKNT